MGALATMNPTLMDMARATNPDGTPAKIIELLAATNGILDDMSAVMCNNGTTHVTTIQTGLPETTWRKLYGFVQPTKGTHAQVTDTCGMAENRSQIDEKLYKLNGYDKTWRLIKDRPYQESMNQTIVQTLFYGDTDTNPERFLGLAARYNSHQTTDEDLSSYNVIDGGGEGEDNTSIWGIVWGPNTTHMIFPKGSDAGLSYKDLGEQEISDSNGGRMTVIEGKYQWDIGLSVEDWRSVARIANLDVSALQSGTDAANLFNLLTELYDRLEDSMPLGRTGIYCNRVVLTALDKQAQAKTNLNLTYENIAGKRVLTYRGIPIRKCKGITNAEAVVPAAS